MMPNASVPLVGSDGRPTRSLQTLVPGLSALDVVVDGSGMATPLFTARLQKVARKPLPNVSAQLTDANGLPTRTFTLLLAGLA